MALTPVTDSQTSERRLRETSDAAANEAARRETLCRDGQRSLGENLEQADALIRAAFELAAGLRRL